MAIKKPVIPPIVHRAYSLHEGYHHEPELVKDKSLLHAIKGPSDIPERIQYIRDHYGAKPLRPEQYGMVRKGVAILIGLGIGGLVTAGIATIGAPVLGGAALAYGAMFGVMAGTIGWGVHTAKTMQYYSGYLDAMEKEERAKAAHKTAKREPVEYDNHRTREGSFANDVKTSREKQTGVYR